MHENGKRPAPNISFHCRATDVSDNVSALERETSQKDGKVEVVDLAQFSMQVSKVTSISIHIKA